MPGERTDIDIADAADAADEDFLRQVPLFADLSDAQRSRVLAAAETVQIPAGGWLFKAGDPGDALYVVRHGRLEVVRDDVVIRVLGAGAALGELALLTEGDRSASVRARRETEVLKVARAEFTSLLTGDPAFAVALTRTLGDQLQRTAVAAAPATRSATVITVVALQAHMQLATARLVDKLAAALAHGAETVHLLRGSHIDVDPNEYGRMLDRCEGQYDHVLLAADDPDDDSPWNDFCLRQADRVVGVADPGAGGLPAGLAGLTGVTDLVSVARVVRATTIGPWLEALRPEAHHHVDPGQGFDKGVERLGRRLAGRAVGVVLSGGGSRGMAHIGVFAALEEAGVVVDRLGGTSMGSFVAGLAGLGLSPAEMVAVCREELVVRKPFNDYTVPRHSLIKARKAEAMLMRVFGERRVEELERPFFAVSSDLLSGEEVIHRRGPLAVAVGISMCLPGLVPPVVAGDRLLVDGGVLNNLPVDIMADSGEGPIIAVDVMRRPAPQGPKPVKARAARRARPSPFGLFSPDDNLPSLVDILARSTVLGSWRRAEANRAKAAVIITPELTDVGLLEFRRLDAIVERGYTAAQAAIASLPALWRT
ncbi:MAG TPA: patatin-like phospholipase family protein [Acidimicrobiales bacterium]|jgi:predicted acylesterase/phospholipase RssA/CRP-like cAMP-binding protein|nr:patatin-like phospholipase family protein [Acidimicrobiales bacterium]